MAPPSPSDSIDGPTSRGDREDMMKEVEEMERSTLRKRELRNKVVEEILASERAYLGHMNVLMRVRNYFGGGVSFIHKKLYLRCLSTA